MVFIAFNLTLFEIIILQLGALILGVTIYFFIVSKRKLSQTLQQSKSQLNLPLKKKAAEKPAAQQPDEILDNLQYKIEQFKTASKAVPAGKQQAVNNPPELLDHSTIGSLKDSVLRQQQTLDTLLQKIDTLEGEVNDKDELKNENETLQQQVEKLEMKLESKETEIKKLKQQEMVAQQMASRIDEVYKEFEALQKKIASLEKGAGRANSLALELEDIKQSNDQLHKELIRKQEKLEEAIAENQRIHSLLNVTEDKLAEANLQRQQLQKKVQFLQDMNNDMQHMTESNHKLNNELRRIGELESMLSMIAEERDRLLDKGHK
jgi:chromosome segregation ATPase